MKSVILVRHAKSSWDDPVLADFDRPLNERGKQDAPRMAARLLDRKVKIDAFLTSPAKRARKTAAFFAEAWHLPKDQLLLIPDLYHAEPEAFYQTIANAPAKAGTIALFSHNPGITSFANLLTTVTVDDMPTCAIFAVKADIQQWSEFRNATKEFWFFDYPKLTAD